jgi:cell division protein FtsA
MGSITRSTFSKKKLDEIVSARLGDCFELIEAHLKKLGRNALLPAGVIITGGGAGTNGIKELAESTLKLPARLAEIRFGQTEKTSLKDAIWSTAYGLAVVGFNAEDEQRSVGIRSVDKIKAHSKKGLRTLSDWFTQFLP